MNITGQKCTKHDMVLLTREEKNSCKWYLFCPECEKEMKDGLERLFDAPPDTQELIRKAVEEEREACAKIAESTPTTLLLNGTFMSERIAKAIRSRSAKEK